MRHEFVTYITPRATGRVTLFEDDAFSHDPLESLLEQSDELDEEVSADCRFTTADPSPFICLSTMPANSLAFDAGIARASLI